VRIIGYLIGWTGWPIAHTSDAVYPVTFGSGASHPRRGELAGRFLRF
jgi:hypothetical protein